MTGYVATRWYRAPEIMLNWMHYNQTGDVSPRGAGGPGEGVGPGPRGQGPWGAGQVWDLSSQIGRAHV